jgi:hypothetical protein
MDSSMEQNTAQTGATRQFNLGPNIRLGFAGENAAMDYARWLLTRMGANITELTPGDFDVDMPVLMAGALKAGADSAAVRQKTPLAVRLWDFHVGKAGSGVQASAVSGVSWVIGLPGQAPLYLSAHVPEKWCGTLGASAALSYYVERITLPGIQQTDRVFDVSAAEILRGFADQNFGNHKQIPTSWRRNGRVSPEHGGIFPQGFFKCQDGYVAVIGRSRPDWALMLKALGDPAWAIEEYRNPFKVALNAAPVEALFEQELQKYTRKDLLGLALKFGATFAPIYSKAEIPAEKLVRDSFFDDAGLPTLPFEILADQ